MALGGDVPAFTSEARSAFAIKPRDPRAPDARDYAATFRKLKALTCDVFLAPHASFFGLEEKARAIGTGKNPFVDANAFQKYVATAEQNFLKQLEKERQGP